MCLVLFIVRIIQSKTLPEYHFHPATWQKHSLDEAVGKEVCSHVIIHVGLAPTESDLGISVKTTNMLTLPLTFLGNHPCSTLCNGERLGKTQVSVNMGRLQ